VEKMETAKKKRLKLLDMTDILIIYFNTDLIIAKLGRK